MSRGLIEQTAIAMRELREDYEVLSIYPRFACSSTDVQMTEQGFKKLLPELGCTEEDVLIKEDEGTMWYYVEVKPLNPVYAVTIKYFYLVLPEEGTKCL